jgi:hypothetical protein
MPGTEGMAGHKDYSHRFRGFFGGTVGSVVVGSLVAALVFPL